MSSFSIVHFLVIIQFPEEMCDEHGLSEFLILPSTSGFQEQDEAESFQWGHNTTLIFLDLYTNYRQQVGSLKIKNLERMFEEIAKELRYRTKQNISPANCENRWKHLERTYKKYKDNNNKTGRGRKDFEYAEIMDEILGKKKNIHPVLLLSSDTVISDSGMEANIGVVVVGEENSDTVNRKNYTEKKMASVKPSHNRNKKLRADVLREIREDRKVFYKKFLEIEEGKLREKQKKNEILKERNALLKQYMLKELPVFHIDEI